MRFTATAVRHLYFDETCGSKILGSDRFHSSHVPTILFNVQAIGERGVLGLGRGGGKEGGNGVSRRAAALSFLRESEEYQSLERVLEERRQYLADMEAQV